VVEEPLSLVGAAAHLTAVSGRGRRWYARPMLRRAATGLWLARVAAAAIRGATGIRLLAISRREAA
jgi:hypothetical protein